MSGPVEIDRGRQGELRRTEVLTLGGSPLLEIVLREGFHLGTGRKTGGEVSLEPLERVLGRSEKTPRPPDNGGVGMRKGKGR